METTAHASYRIFRFFRPIRLYAVTRMGLAIAMKGEVVTIVRLPVTEIAAVVAEKNGITVPLTGAKLDAGHLILSFANAAAGDAQAPKAVSELVGAQAEPIVTKDVEDAVAAPKQGRRSSKKRKRHRMKTRGWEVVATITNAYGQKACVYRPF